MTHLAAQTRHIKFRERRLFPSHTALHAKENEILQTVVDAKKSLVSLKSRVGLLQNQSRKAGARAQSLRSDLDDATEELALTKEKLSLYEQQRKTDNAAFLKRIDSLNTLLAFSNQKIDQLKFQLPKIIKKVPRAQGGLEWDEEITQLCMKMHTHRTPPESIAANIASVCALISPI